MSARNSLGDWLCRLLLGKLIPTKDSQRSAELLCRTWFGFDADERFTLSDLNERRAKLDVIFCGFKYLLRANEKAHHVLRRYADLEEPQEGPLERGNAVDVKA